MALPLPSPGKGHASPPPPPPPPAKRAKGERGSSEKVCLVCTCTPKHRNGLWNDNFHIFILDLKIPNTEISIAPVLRVKYHCFLAMCVLNSTLYLFEGFELKSNVNGKRVYKYDLSTADPTLVGPIVGMDELTEMSGSPPPMPMQGLKRGPLCIPTPDHSKILVFSGCIKVKDGFNGFKNFELYDPVSNTWEVLPEMPPPITSEGQRRTVRAYAFLDKSTFYIQTPEKEMFTLDLNSVESGWQQQLHFFGGPATCSTGKFFVVGDRLWVDSHRAYDLHKYEKLRIPLPSFQDLPVRTQCHRRSVLLRNGGEGGVSSLCVVGPTATFRGDILYPHMVVDVVDFDLVTAYSGNHQFNPTNTTSYKFVQDAVPYLTFYPQRLFILRD